MGGRGAGTERGAEVTELGWSVERLFRPLRSAHMLCTHIGICTLQGLVVHSNLLSLEHSSPWTLPLNDIFIYPPIPPIGYLNVKNDNPIPALTLTLAGPNYNPNWNH